jgi:hypothetical protein
MQTQKSFVKAGLTVGASLACLPVVLAQMPNAYQQVDTLDQHRQLQQTAQALDTNSVPALYDSETSDVGPQSVLQMKARRTWIQAYADAQFFYTDNVFLADRNKQDANVLVSTVMAELAPTPYNFEDGQFAPRLGYQHQWFNYDLIGSSSLQIVNNQFFGNSGGLDTFDFNVSTVFADVSWRRQNWQFTLGADFRQLLDSGSYSEFYREGVPRWSVSRDFSLTPAIGISIGYQGDYRVTETASPVPSGFGTDYNDRTDQGIYVVGSWRLCRHAILQPFYNFQYTHYTSIDRDDLLNSFGLTLYCPLTKNITLRGFVGYDNFNTDGFYSQNYEQLAAGGGLNLSVRF